MEPIWSLGHAGRRLVINVVVFRGWEVLRHVLVCRGSRVSFLVSWSWSWGLISWKKVKIFT